MSNFPIAEFGGGHKQVQGGTGVQTKMKKLTSEDEVKLESSYESVKQVLLDDADASRLSKPLGYWVLPNDRRLPLALLDRSLGDLLATPFRDLSATPGIGQKKISSLVMLLQRATKDEPPSVPVGLREYTEQLSDLPQRTEDPNEFDPSMVSEALWSQWQSVVRGALIGKEKLGRLAPSLQNLPTVIWHTPLNQYLDHTVNEIRRLRTHGEKRVRCVLEVFHHVQNKLGQAQDGENLSRLLTPPNILRVQDWSQAKLSTDLIPSEEEIRSELVEPLLAQIQIDSGDTVYNLAAERLGINGEPQCVREQSKVLGVTRARVYQLLEDCGKVISIRWPEGKQRLELLTAKFASSGHDNERLALFFGMRELFFPEKVNTGKAAPPASAVTTAPALGTQQSAVRPTDPAIPMASIERRVDSPLTSPPQPKVSTLQDNSPRNLPLGR